MKPIEPSLASTQNYSVPFVAINNSMETFDGYDHQCTPEKYVHQTDAHMIFMWYNNLSILWFFAISINSAVCAERLQAGFCDFVKYTKTIGLPLYLLSKNNFLHKNRILGTT